MTAVKQLMNKVWNSVSMPSLYYHDEAYFIARFKDIKERDEILQNGPYSIFFYAFSYKEVDS